MTDAPVPLGPDSLTWRYFGDWRGLLQGLWAGSMQNMHPELGAGVEEHSRFFEERTQRLFRSLYPIGGVVFDQDRARQTAEEIRGYHTDIKGIDDKSRRYHALNPDTFYWAHATFFVGMLHTAERFAGGLTEQQKRQLFDEHIQWYRLYGMSMRPVPKTWPEFQQYWDRMCRDVLEDNKATRDVLDISDVRLAGVAQHLPTWINRVAQRGFVWLTIGLYDPPVRELLGFAWTPRDEWLLNRFGNAVHLVFRLIPERRRYHPRARAGWDRATGRIPVDAPLVETPRRHLPPRHRRDDPMHYSPKSGYLGG